ncbi:NAD-dependent epimerase/dehydratase family protein [Candidatus Binatia bacterium]|nr:NAD-dependent epimerase/dehydratase family protein [Candidatus Binatia bacterium]
MKVLVTGATGFLGRSIVARLQREAVEVRALVRPGRAGLPPDVEPCPGDLKDEASIATAVQGVDAVVHAGAKVDTSGKWEEFAEVNIRGTRRVISAARASGVGRIVHISSLSVYDVDRDGVTITEDSPYESEANARGHYSRSKLAADRLALTEARAGAPVVVLRPGLLYGPGKRPPLARQSFAVKGWKLILARPNYPLPMSYVDNTADAVWLALHCPDAIGQAFTIVDENIRQNELVSLYRAASGEVWRPVFLPVGTVALAAGVAERGLRLVRRRSPVTYHQVRRATDRAWYDCSRAEQVLGWRPAVPVHEGLRRTFESIRTLANAPAAA